MPSYQFFLASSLEKVFADARPEALQNKNLTALQGERISFQVVYTAEDGHNGSVWQHFKIEVNGAPSEVNIRTVELVPGEYPCWTQRDKNYLRTAPGLFPDLLLPSDGRVRPVSQQFRSVWVDFSTENVPHAEYTISVSAKADDKTDLGNGVIMDGSDAVAQNWSDTITLSVLAAKLPPQTLLHTEWFHADCLADYYHVKALSEEHWAVLENYIKFAGESCGINMLLTPIFTPPLDTVVGGERTTVQLVKIKRKAGVYSFDFEALHRWCTLCRKYGITHLELAHLFTQWGAKATPKIIAEVDGEEKRIFGWDVAATSTEYSEFLQAFIPALLKELHQMGYTKEQLYFHVSDEPSEEHLDTYLAAKRQVETLLDGYIIMDALSSYEFYKRGLVAHPVPADDHIQPFIDNKVKNLWVYYCCAQSKDVPNRFFAMPSSRNRIMGVLMYLYDIKGFLHWGYNFYNSQFSIKPIDPYRVTDCDLAFPAGDPFLVYPAPDGTPYSSLRNEVQMQAYYDLRSLQLLESMTNRSYVESIIYEGVTETITFKQYPLSASWLLRLNSRVKAEISARL